MSRGPRAKARGAPKSRPRPAAGPRLPRGGLPVTHPAMIATLVMGGLCVLISASYRLYDTDLWHLLAVGRAIWAHGLPRVDLWTWTSFGEPSFVSSWAFRALIWPLWSSGGVGALFVWRWGTTLATFAAVYATARTLGARGLSAVVVLVACSLLYRVRTDVRPETLAALLLALELWILERDRAAPAPGSRAIVWIPVLMLVWVNVHISYYLGFLLLGLYGADALSRAWRGADDPARRRVLRLAGVAAIAAAAAFLNPYGFETLARPFRFALAWRHDPLFAAIDELRPLTARAALENGLFAWPLLVLARARRRGWDVAEVGACASFTALALSSNRFVATYALIAGPFVARDLSELFESRRWPVPRWPLGARAAFAGAACVALSVPAWLRPELPLGIGLRPRSMPQAACDFMEAHGIGGRGFNHFHLGGYLAYRFWGTPARLPFMSTQPELASAEERRLYVGAFQSAQGWSVIQERYRFDWALLDREQLGNDQLLDLLDQDSTWVMVFADDAAELLVRRGGASGAAADSFGYRIVPAGREGRARLGAACEADSGLRARAKRELDRMIASSSLNGGASHLRGFLALMDHDLPAARGHLERAARLDPLLPGVHDRLGAIALAQGRPRDALRELALERRRHDPPPGSFYLTGVALSRLGRLGEARAAYRREVERHPDFHEASDSLAALEGRAAP